MLTGVASSSNNHTEDEKLALMVINAAPAETAKTWAGVTAQQN